MKYALEPKNFDLKKWREGKKLSIRQLAEMTGIGHAHLWRIESDFYVASPETAKKIFSILPCKSSPLCSHNTNGRSLDKPCSISLTSQKNSV